MERGNGESGRASSFAAAQPIKPINPVSNLEVAWDMAYAEKPFQDRIYEIKQQIPRGLGGLIVRIFKASEIQRAEAIMIGLGLEGHFAAGDVRHAAVKSTPSLRDELFTSYKTPTDKAS